MENKFLIGILGVALVGTALGALFLSKGVSVNVNTSATPAEQGYGSNFTVNPAYQNYVDSADLRQNVQAMAERMASSSQYSLLQASSAGQMEAVLPTALAGSWSFSGDTRATSFVQTGSITTFNTTSTITAAQVCNSPTWIVTAATGTAATLTYPGTSTLYADCFTTNGDWRAITVINGSAVSSTILAAGSGGSMDISSSTTLGPGKSALTTVVRTTANAYVVSMLTAGK